MDIGAFLNSLVSKKCSILLQERQFAKSYLLHTQEAEIYNLDFLNFLKAQEYVNGILQTGFLRFGFGAVGKGGLERGWGRVGEGLGKGWGGLWGGKTGSICHFAFALVLQCLGGPNPEGPARQIDVSRQKLSPHCLEAIFDSQLPSPKLSPKMPPKLSLPTREGLLSSFKINPAVRVIARQVRDKNCLAAIFAPRHQSVSSGPLGRYPDTGKKQHEKCHCQTPLSCAPNASRN